MNIRISESEAVAFFRERDRFLIFTHNSADADTVGSARALVLALRKLGKQADAFNREGVPARLSFLRPEEVFLAELPPLEGRTLVSVDVASPKLLSEPESSFVFALSIDHHMVNSMRCERLYLRDDFPAAGELVFLLLEEMGFAFGREPDISEALYAAISSDSGGFRYASTRPDTMRHAAALMEAGIDFARINRLLFECKTPVEVAIEKLGYERLELLFGGRFALLAVTQEDLDEAGATAQDCEGLNQIPRQIAGVQASAVIRPKDGEIKVSLRSNEDVDVASLAALFGGGGHFHAAGFSVRGGTVAGVRRTLLEKVEGVLL